MIAFTACLSACRLGPSRDALLDPDGDGAFYGEDCDNSRPDIYPGNTEVWYDGLDNDCDPSTEDRDRDHDGYEAEQLGGPDCDDANPAINPAAADLVDVSGLDQNCDGLDGVDADQDGVASTLTGGDDCDDEDPAVSPDVDETPYDGLDNDCDPLTVDDDLDQDGQRSTATGGEDCDDGDAAVYTGAEEICDDGVVNDCAQSEAGAMAACGLEGTLSLRTADLKFLGEAAGDDAGWGLSGAGDVDGDGLADVLVGAEGNDGSGTDAGAVYLLLGAGLLAGARGVSSLGLADWTLTGEGKGDGAGAYVSGVGDLDQDGFADLLVGAQYEDSGGGDAGAVYLLYGGGAALAGATRLDQADLKITGEQTGDWFRRGVSVGDVDGDGAPELLFGANRADGVGEDCGAAYLYWGGEALLASRGTVSVADAPVRLEGEAAEDQAGAIVAGVGDLDGDGLPEIAIGAHYEDSGGTNAGAVYLWTSGGAISAASGTASLAGADLKLIGEDAGDLAGVSVVRSVDLDGDGLDELVVSAFQRDIAGTDSGAVYVLLASTLASTSGTTLDLSSADVQISGEAAGDETGWPVVPAGDVDGDGRGDLLVGAKGNGTTAALAGAAYLLLAQGALAGVPATMDLSEADVKWTGEAAYDTAGWSLSTAGDVNGDGFADLLIGARNEDSAGAGAGAAYLVFGGGY